MPVKVHFPVRLCISPRVSEGDYEDIADALGASLGRALAASQREVLAKRGGYVSVETHAPSFTWCGGALGELSVQQRAELEALIQDACESAIEQSGVTARESQAADAPVPLADPAMERVDPRRFLGPLGTYVVPFYDEPDNQGGVTITFTEGETIQRGQHFEAIWPEFDDIEDVKQQWEFELATRSRRWPASGYLGTIFQWVTGRKVILIARFPEGTQVSEGISLVDVTYITTERLPGPGNRTQLVERDLEYPPEAAYCVAFFRRVSDPASLQEALHDHYGPIIERELRDYAAGLSVRLSEAELNSRLEEAVEQRLSVLMERYHGARQLVLLLVDQRPYLIRTSVPLPDDLNAELIPLVDVVPVEAHPELPGAGDGAQPGQGAGEGQGAAGGRGGFVVGRGEEGDGSLFPAISEAGGESIVCRPFLGEPIIEELAAGAGGLQAAVDDIAFRLQMPGCNHVAQFCLNAALVIASRAHSIDVYGTENQAFTATIPAQKGNLGVIDFTPTASPAIQLLRHLADVVARVGDLANRIESAYRMQENRDLIQSDWGKNPVSWSLRFFTELTDAMTNAVMIMFLVACRVMMLQLLRASRAALQARYDHFDLYAHLFEQLVRNQLTGIDKLTDLRNRLRNYQSNPDPYQTQFAEGQRWEDATQSVTSALGTPAPAVSPTGPANEIIRRGGELFIRDDANHLWTEHDLDEAIATQRGDAESMDPLVKQLTDIPEVVARLRNGSTALRTELRRLLEDLLAKNQETIDTVLRDPEYAFKAGRIQEGLPTGNIPGTHFSPQGIHLQAHQQIGEFFHGSDWYPAGIKFLFNSELGIESLSAFFEFTGLILLSVICPPAAFLAGVGLASYQYGQALERERLYQSLIDPELVLSRAEVEVELFAAKLGLAMAFIPEAGSILRGLRYSVRAASRVGVAGGVRILGRYVVRRFAASTAEALARASIQAFVREVITAQVLNLLIERALAPVLAEVQREALITGSVGGLQGAAAVRQMLQEERERQLSQ